MDTSVHHTSVWCVSGVCGCVLRVCVVVCCVCVCVCCVCVCVCCVCVCVACVCVLRVCVCHGLLLSRDSRFDVLNCAVPSGFLTVAFLGVNASCDVCHCVLLLANDETKHKKYILSQCALIFGKNMHAQNTSGEVCAHCVPQFMSDFTRICPTSVWSAVPMGMSNFTRACPT